MKLSRRVVAWTVLAVLSVAALAWIGSRVFERAEVEVTGAFRGEARENPLWALVRLYEALGVPARAVAASMALPPRDHAVVVAAPERWTVDKLLAWTAEGGHLLVIPAGPVGTDPLLEALGVGRFEAEGADEDDHESRPDFASDRPDWPRLWAWEETEVLHAEGAPDAAWTLVVRYGEGRATVFSDGAFLRNDTLGEQDHALIAWEALTRLGTPAGVSVIYRDPRPSLLRVLTEGARPLAWSLAVLALAALFATARRFGPRREVPARERRRLREHVQAIGEYLWTVHCEDALVRATRDAMARRLGRGNPPDRRALGVLARRAAESRGLDAAEVRASLDVFTVRDRARFVRLVQLFETLRRSS